MDRTKAEQIEMMIMKELSRDSLSELLDYYGIQLCELEQFMERAKTDSEEGKIKRFWFYCKNCGFEYSGESAEPCSCSLCGTVNDCCYVEEI